MGKDDAVERMLDEIGRRRRPDVSLALTALEVFYEEVERMSEIEMDALATTGYSAVAAEGGAWPVAPVPSWPEECPSWVCRLLDADVGPERFDARVLSKEETAMLALVGLWTITGKHFMRADTSN